jgi:O-antigen ligase
VLEGLTSSTLEVDLSSQFRVVFENALIIPRIEESPLFGHGFGYAYKPPLGIPGTFNSDFAPYYAHNFYLWILVKAGVTGLAIFLWFSLAPILKTFRQSSGLAHASAGAATALLACSFVVPMPIGSPTALLLGALLGAAAAFSSVDSKTPTHAKFHSRHKIRQLNH